MPTVSFLHRFVPGRTWLLRTSLILTLVAPVLWTLWARVPNIVDTPLVSDRGERIAVPIELSYADYPGSNGPHVARMLLYLRNPDALLRHQSMHILVGNYLTRPRLHSAELSVVGTGCVYRTPEGAAYPNNATVPFIRGKECAPVQGTPNGQLLLTARFDGPGRLALWTYRPRSGPPDPDVIYLSDPAWSELGLHVELRGRYMDGSGLSQYRRADLLNYIWDVSSTSAWIWTTVWIGVALLIFGAAVLPQAGVEHWRVLRASVAGFLCSAGAALFYVVLVPPFQAPDEPSHFFGYAFVTGNTRLPDEAARWAWRGHFERIHSHADEKFRPAHVGSPYLDTLVGVSPLGLDRSSITVPAWRRIGGMLKDRPAPRQLLALRLLNAFVFSIAIAACTGMIGRLAGARRPESPIAIFLLVPTLPFFATYASNYAPAVAAYAILASACLILFLDGPRAHWAGLPLGLGLAFAIAATRSALPMVALVSIVLAARLGIGPRSSHTGNLGRIAIFWGGLLAAAVLLGWLFTEWYALSIFNEMARVSPRAAAVAANAVSHPFLLAGAAAGAVAAAEAIGAGIRAWWGDGVRRLVTRSIRPTCLAGICAVAAMMFASVFVRLPHLTLTPGHEGVTTAAYVRQTLATVATPFRFRDHDLQLSTTFWAAFGWVDTFLPPAIVATLSVAGAAAMVIMLHRLSVARDVRRFCWLVAIIVAFFATMAAYAVAAAWVSPLLYGRYLVGAYLVAILVVWSPALCVETSDRAAPPKTHEWMARSAWLLMGIVHSSALVAILSRYF